jgi:hypothetical protein
MALFTSSAQAAFPGQRGKIVFANTTGQTAPRQGEIFTAYEGGPRTQLTHLVETADPAWSADGQKIAFTARPGATGRQGVWTMNADGSNQIHLTSGSDTYSLSQDFRPAWSPDGTKIAFMRLTAPGEWAVMVMNSDGSGVTLLHTGVDPAWSPDGTKIAFADGASGAGNIWTMAPDGSGATPISTHDLPSDDYFVSPDWSPDGRFIVFINSGCSYCTVGAIYRISASGQDRVRIGPASTGGADPAWSPDGYEILYEQTGGGCFYCMDSVWTIDPEGAFFSARIVDDARQPSWQPIVGFPGYPRPRGATPLRVSLVPAFQACIDPNRQHGAPIAGDSCAPPVQESQQLTIGSPDANGRPAKSIGSFQASAIAGDLAYDFRMTDVRLQGSLDDYAGELRLDSALRIADKNSEAGDGATMIDTSLALTVPCAPTADPTVGSDCVLSTTADALAPGTITTGARTVWALGQMRVLDGGADQDADTAGDNSLFAVQGLFVP